MDENIYKGLIPQWRQALEWSFPNDSQASTRFLQIMKENEQNALRVLDPVDQSILSQINAISSRIRFQYVPNHPWIYPYAFRWTDSTTPGLINSQNPDSPGSLFSKRSQGNTIQKDHIESMAIQFPQGQPIDLRIEFQELLPNYLDLMKQLPSLHELCISDCVFEEVEVLLEKISSFTSLKRLGFFKIKSIPKIPNSWKALSELEQVVFHKVELAEGLETIQYWTKLEYLTLQDNRISEIPSQFGKLTNLNFLNIAHNRIETLPESLGNLKNLKTLNCAHNQLASIPENLGALPQLERLILSHNLPLIMPKFMEGVDSVENGEVYQKGNLKIIFKS